MKLTDAITERCDIVTSCEAYDTLRGCCYLATVMQWNDDETTTDLTAAKTGNCSSKRGAFTFDVAVYVVKMPERHRLPQRTAVTRCHGL